MTAYGRARLWMEGEPQAWYKNLELYELSVADAYLLRGEPHRGLYIYFEFERLVSPGDDPVLPTFDAAGGMASGYYAALSGSVTKDFVRAQAYAVAGDPSSSNYPESNIVRVFAQIRTATGVHGKSFDEAGNAKVYAGALVLARDASDWTQDLVLARVNYNPAEQQLADADAATGFEWELTRTLS